MNQLICQVASSQLGVKEVSGNSHNAEILRYSTDIGLKGITTDEIPWCAIFVCWVLWKCGSDHPVTARARDFDEYGIMTLAPEPGDIVVFWRGVNRNSGLGHVGFFLGFSADGKFIYVLGGNQANSVAIAIYSIDQVIAYRRIASVTGQTALTIPKAPLDWHSAGDSVKNLQKILLYLGYYKGNVDGKYGAGTIAAVEDFNDKYRGQFKNEVYDKWMETKLFEIMNA